MSTDLTLCFDTNIMHSGVPLPDRLDPKHDFRRLPPRPILTSSLRMDRGSAILRVVELAVENGGGETGPVWWTHGEEAAETTSTSISGVPIEWCRAGDIVRIAADYASYEDANGEPLEPCQGWSKAVLALLALLPERTIVYAYWS